MHILWLKTELLHPIDKGGKIRTYETLKHLKGRHHITYLCLDDGGAAPDAVSRAAEYSHDLVRIPFDAPAREGMAFYAHLARNVASSLPWAVARYRSPEMREAIGRAVRERDVDLVVCDFLFPSINLADGLGVPTVLFQHNVEAAIWERHTQAAGHPLKRRYMRAQWDRMRAWEGRECRRVDHVVAVSEGDARAFERAYGVDAVSHVPTGVDVEYFRPSGSVRREPGRLVFTGSMDWMPNEDGVTWFHGEVLPRIVAGMPGAQFVIVGRNPPAAVRALAERDPRVQVTGTVPDVRPFLEGADVFVVPLRIGGGTRLKIFEAMAEECAIVSTSIGAEGLPVRGGEELLLADDPATFADRCVQVMRDTALRERLGRAAGERVRRDFGWEAAATQFATACEETLRRARGSQAARAPQPA